MPSNLQRSIEAQLRRSRHRATWLRDGHVAWRLVLALTATACEPPPQERSIGQACTQALIHGASAAEPHLDAIGGIGVLDDAGGFHVLCSGSLIAKELVLTAKHCLQRANGEPLRSIDALYVALGPDAGQPRLLERVVAAHVPPVPRAGVSELGSDVAVLQLAAPVSDVVPLALSPQSPAQLLGTEVVTFGYGTDVEGCQQAAHFEPLRRRGTETLRAAAGNVFDLIYGSYAAYLDDVLRFKDKLSAQRRYENGQLNPGYEAWAESTSDSQVCYGDSGGPVAVQQQDGSLQVLGVTSWTWPSPTQLCDHGSVIATFGPETWTLLQHLLTQEISPL